MNIYTEGAGTRIYLGPKPRHIPVGYNVKHPCALPVRLGEI